MSTLIKNVPMRACRSAARRRSAARAGFTLVELLLVLVILGTLAAIVIPKFAGRTEQARVTAAHTQISNLETSLDAYETDCGSYPQGADGLLQLMENSSNAQGWRGPYMKKEIPNDPWGHPYVYECPGKHNATGYDIMSLGPDGQTGTNDDITSWGTGQN
jgi:general secretion pathway protein G